MENYAFKDSQDRPFNKGDLILVSYNGLGFSDINFGIYIGNGETGGIKWLPLTKWGLDKVLGRAYGSLPFSQPRYTARKDASGQVVTNSNGFTIWDRANKLNHIIKIPVELLTEQQLNYYKQIKHALIYGDTGN